MQLYCRTRDPVSQRKHGVRILDVSYKNGCYERRRAGTNLGSQACRYEVG